MESTERVEKVKKALLSMQRFTWEHGVTAQAFLESGEDDWVVLLAKNADPIIKWLEQILHVKIFDQAVYGMDRFPSVVNLDDVFAVVVVAMTISLLATIYPAWRAARMDPAEALRYE